MKTLKFMLAAATAIGLASATQADQYNTTGFEKLSVGTAVTTGVTDNSNVDSYFYYAGDTAADNESVIAEAGDMTGIARPRGASDVDATRYNILQVSTGTDPLMRTYKTTTMQGGELKPQAPTELEGTDVYVDTLVQFTVTPYTDEVKPGSADKLMIYLKETTNEVEGVTTYTTNLVVVGGCVAGAEDTLAAAQEYVVQGFHVDGQHQDCSFAPNTWYRLTVKVIANVGGRSGTYPGFCVYVDGKLCYFDVAAWNEGNKNFRNSEYETANTSKELVLSLLANGSNVASLQGVGFAGEGKVDDIVFSDLDPFATALDFTLTWGNGLSAVEYTITNTTFSLSGETSPATISVPIDYPDVTFTVANADGVQKTLSATASGSTTGIDATDTEFFWSDYLGEAVSGAYEIDSTAEFILFQKGVNRGLATDGEVFKQTADVDLSDVDGFTGVGVTNTDSASGGTPFAGTYDGQGHKIANVKFSWRKYAGIFNQVNGATIQNLTGENLGFSETGSGEHGCAMVGNGTATLVALKSQYTGGFSVTNTHNAGGIMVRAMGGTTFNSCTNTADLVCCRDKMGGICCFMAPAANTTVAFINCVNTGNYTLVTPPEGSKYNPGSNGFAGILGYTQGAGDVTMQGCKNTGSFVNNLDTTQFSNDVFSGEFIGKVTSSGAVTDLGGNKFVAANKVIGTGDTNSTFQYATVDNGVGTTVTALAKDEAYLLLKDVAPTFALAAAGDYIAFDTALGYTVDGSGVTYATGKVTPTTSGTVTTYTAAALATVTVTVSGGANATATWTVDGASAEAPATLTEGQSYAVYYTANDGYEFGENATTNAAGTAGTENITITISDAVSASVTPTLDPSANVITAKVSAVSAEAAIAAVTVTPPTGVDAAAYTALFNITATPVAGEAGYYNVVVEGFKDSVVEAVYADAVNVFEGDTSVAVPAGVYYRITPSTDLSTWGAAQTGASEGTVTVTKPGTNTGFLKVELSTVPFPVE